MTTKTSRIVYTIVRLLMGLTLIVSGVNAFLNFMPAPPELPAKAAAFNDALRNSGYMIQLIGATHLIVGVLLVINRLVPLAVLLFAPFIVNAILFHVFLLPSGLVMALVYLAFELYLAWVCRRAFAPIFVTPRPAPV